MGDAGGLVSGITGAVAASKASDNGQDAQKVNGIWSTYMNALNTKAAKEAADLNYQHWQESRGSQGSAILPLYAKALEGKISGDMTDMWNAPRTSVADYRSEMGKTAGARDSARSAVGDIFNGNWQSKMMADFAPVKAARTSLTRQSAMDALSKTLGEIGNAQSAKGYEGDSMANRMLSFQANRGMGDALASANFQNLMEERGIKDQAINNQITYANLPFQMATNDISAMRLPEDTYMDQFSRRLAPLSFLKIGGTQPYAVQPYTQNSMPTVTPVAGQDQVMWQGLSNMAGGLQSIGNQSNQQAGWQQAMGLPVSSWNGNLLAGNNSLLSNSISSLFSPRASTSVSSYLGGGTPDAGTAWDASFVDW